MRLNNFDDAGEGRELSIGTGSSRPLTFVTGGTARLEITAAGVLQAPPGGSVSFAALGSITAPAGSNLLLQTVLLSNTVRLNSITDSTTASGDLIGFQSKPRSGVTGSQSIYGGQVSAQVSNGIALSGSGSLIGFMADVFLRGTSAGTIAGDVRGIQIELVTDDAGTRDITGYVTALRIRKAFSAGTVTGVQSVIRVEKPEVQTNSESYDCLFELPGTMTGAWNNDPATENDGALQGYIKVVINGVNKYIRLYAVGNTAD